MKKIKVAVLFGGCSDEYKISLKSVHNIMTHIDTSKYEVIIIGITKDGKWYKYDGPVDMILDDAWLDTRFCTQIIMAPNRDIHGFVEIRNEKVSSTKIDVVFPVLHGKCGEDGSIQGLFELANIPYVGCKMCSSVLCMDKDVAHQNVKSAGEKVTSSITIYDYEIIESRLEEINALKYPLFVKPASSGSSFGVTKVNAQNELMSAIKEARKYGCKIIIEESVDGCEVGCAVLGIGENLMVGEVDQIELSHGFFRIHQEEKPEIRSENSTIHVPAHLEANITAQIKESAKTIYNALGCTGLARVDMFLTPQNEIVFNEVNTMPGFTSYSRYPRMMEAAGISISEVIDKVIELALSK
ncbi:vancomycin B-type resistance protein VanB [Clostridium tepidiprofundi DSM 19306]|uniref:D-alanine--D-alanine ligase n=1 Tax=Clostridium tepidiprofundi DSM 19306 TaxID=1121338 RepID=A0A151AS13_9CLOT|nr:D-alanine--D-alanine ligase family protein [Clostridium tepidiprofundi]KYH30441.1 vancomycin B-type resistance protein VanB [Clostridium tepidiprofundi DSM 19306]